MSRCWGEVLPGPRVFDLLVGAVLLPLGIWLVASGPASGPASGRRARPIPAPVLIGSGRPAAEVAPAALASTFATSVAGMATFTILSSYRRRLPPRRRRGAR